MSTNNDSHLYQSLHKNIKYINPKNNISVVNHKNISRIMGYTKPNDEQIIEAKYLYRKYIVIKLSIVITKYSQLF